MGNALARKIDAVASARGWDNNQLADLLDCHRNTVQAMRTKSPDPKCSVIIRLSELTGLPVAWWLDDSQEQPPDPLSDAEVAIAAIVRRLGPEETLRRLVSGQGQAQSGKLPGLEVVHAHSIPRSESHNESVRADRDHIGPGRRSGR
jgi:hypothetical protein